jgi:acetyl-CoA carboxylase biotin carboxylase subunit
VTDAEAIHPGYGFLSENPKFAAIVAEAGFKLIGPKADHIRLMGDKISAIEFAKSTGLPTIPGSGAPLDSAAEAAKVAKKIGYPVIIKAAAGGGGRGMKIAHSELVLRNQFSVAQAEAMAAFGDGRVYLEKYLEKPRHIEVQILGDQFGNVVALGERDCSVQRRHQKLIEESPSPAGLTEKQLQKLYDVCVKACKKIGYVGLGTMEFLFENGEFYFIEMNTRVQVEHPVTEFVTGLDLIAEQIKVAAGHELPMKGITFTPRGHSIEVRINAENPENFRPSPGVVTDYFTPGGPGIRIDSCLFPGAKVPAYYDSLVAKLIVHGKDRAQAVRRLQRALEEFVIGGIQTSIPLLKRIVATEAFIKGDYDVKSLERFIQGGRF